jgi:arylsulfatase A-like enzyme
MQRPPACCLILILLATTPFLFAAPQTDRAPRPNIIFILADDLGSADPGFAGGREIRTPQLDKLAAAGARLDAFYVQPVCSPTRAALLTGRYPMRYGLQTGVVRPWAEYGLPLEERTLAQALQQAGYRTSICGKWHLGAHERAYLPTRRGFDHQYGHYMGAIDYFEHTRDGGFDWHQNDGACRDEGYSTALIAREAVRWIREQSADRPFFLYVAFNAVHAPHQVPEHYKQPYSSLPEPRRTYAGMLAAMDEAIGQIVAALDQKHFRANTLIVFSSDNGGPAPGRVTSNGELRAGKGTLYEGGVRVCAFATWDGKIKPGSRIGQQMHMVDWYPTLLKLAGASLEQKLPLDGRDAWPLLTGGNQSLHDRILLNSEPQRGALRAGDWKLVLNGLAPPEGEETRPRKAARQRKAADAVELFNLAKDPGEQTNLAEKEPGKLKELRAHYDALAATAVPPKIHPRKPGFKAPAVWGEPENK